MNKIEYDSAMTLSENGILLFGELVQKEYLDECGKKYFLTKGFNYYYLYQKSIYNDSYATVATGMKAIKEYIKSMNLQGVNDDNNKN